MNSKAHLQAEAGGTSGLPSDFFEPASAPQPEQAQQHPSNTGPVAPSGNAQRGSGPEAEPVPDAGPLPKVLNAF